MNTTPSSITLDAHTLSLQWPSGPSRLQADYLRAHCRCSQCRQTALRGGPTHGRPSVTLENAAAVGSYGLQLQFSDGHDRGIYPWAYLLELAKSAAGAGATAELV